MTQLSYLFKGYKMHFNKINLLNQNKYSFIVGCRDKTPESH